MRKHILVVMTAILVLAMATVAMAADPHVGTWKLNLAKSKFNPGPAPTSWTVTMQAQDNGIKVVADVVDAEGKATRGGFAAKYDGKDYPFTGNPDGDMISLKRIDANTWAEVLKKAGKEISSGRVVVSKDGKTMTRTEKGKNSQGVAIDNTLVCDKQ